MLCGAMSVTYWKYGCHGSQPSSARRQHIQHVLIQHSNVLAKTSRIPSVDIQSSNPQPSFARFTILYLSQQTNVRHRVFAVFNPLSRYHTLIHSWYTRNIFLNTDQRTKHVCAIEFQLKLQHPGFTLPKSNCHALHFWCHDGKHNVHIGIGFAEVPCRLYTHKSIGIPSKGALGATTCSHWNSISTGCFPSWYCVLRPACR